MGQTSENKQRIAKAVDELDAKLREIALTIHAHPELSSHEKKASQWLTEKIRYISYPGHRGS